MVSGGAAVDAPGLKRGRPTVPYDKAGFRTLIEQHLSLCSWTIWQVADRAGINHGTIARAWFDDTGFSPAERRKLMDALEISVFEQAPYRIELDADKLIHLDPAVAAEPELEHGQDLLIRGFYDKAEDAFKRELTKAEARGDIVLQADAAGRLVWRFLEEGMFKDAFTWAERSLKVIQGDTPDIRDIINSIPRSRHLSTAEALPYYVLSRNLHLKCKLFSVLVVYYGQMQYFAEARALSSLSIELDDRLQLAIQRGYDELWEAELLSASQGLESSDALRRLKRIRGSFVRGSLGYAYLMRNSGVIYWKTGDYKKAQQFSIEALEALAHFADQRGIGPGLYVLSRSTAELARKNAWSCREAQRYALMGGALDPNGFVLHEAGRYLLRSDPRDLQHDIDDLLEQKKPFDIVRQILSRLADGTDTTATDLLERNLERLRTEAERQRETLARDKARIIRRLQ